MDERGSRSSLFVRGFRATRGARCRILKAAEPPDLDPAMFERGVDDPVQYRLDRLCGPDPYPGGNHGLTE